MSKKNEANSNLIPASEIKPASPGLETIRRKLAEAKGPRYWRTRYPPHRSAREARRDGYAEIRDDRL